MLSAVFLPMAFFGGSTGVIYRQFSLTIISAMILSVLVALILSPALTSHLLKQKSDENGDLERRLARSRIAPWVARTLTGGKDWFNRTFDRGVEALRRRGADAWSTASGCSC